MYDWEMIGLLYNQTIKKKVKKYTAMVLIGVLLLVLLPGLHETIRAETGTPALWPEVFTPYTDANGNNIYDPAGEPGISPIDVDITSGVNRGAGYLPSVYFASDTENFFVRLRVKGNPYDRKGGFLSTVWLVQLAVGGEHVATMGVNGKSPSADYVYVSNTDNTSKEIIYTTDNTGTIVPGTRIEPAQNGQYYMDFQVPISKLIAISGGAIVDGNTLVQLFFGSSKAANLSVVNKDGMNDSNITEFTGASISLNSQPPSIEIDGGSRMEYPSDDLVMRGSLSPSDGTLTVDINDIVYTPDIVGSTWSLALPAAVTDQGRI
jgi:hypothetical protein